MGSKILSRNFRDIEEGSVIEQIIRVAALSYDRLPVMEVIFERYALILAPALKIYTTVPVDVVLSDIRAQVASGVAHVTFSDPDFLNGPTHAARIVEAPVIAAGSSQLSTNSV